MDKLLQEVIDDGWNDKRRTKFTQRYGALIRGNILYHLGHCFGGSQVKALGEYLKSLQKHSRASVRNGISGQQLELVQNSWEEVFMKVFCRDGKGQNLIEKWAAYAEEKKSKGEKFRDFETYLKGAVQIAFWKHLRKQKELREQVAMEPEQAQSWERKGNQEAMGDDIPVENEVLVYWDRLLRCQKPDLKLIRQDLIQVNRTPQTVLTWACASLKHKLDAQGRERAIGNLMAFMTFQCSQQGKRRESALEDISPDRLSLERIRGRYFRWKKDICQRIFCKSIRKDRVMEKIRDLLLESPYSDMIQ